MGQAGLSMPQGDLTRKLTYQPAAGILLRSPYYGQFDCHAAFQYSPLGGDESVPKTRLLKLATGLSYNHSFPCLPRAGLQLINYTVIVNKKDGTHSRIYESEFGACPFIFIDIPVVKEILVQAVLEWDIIFNTPQYSHFLNAKISAGWQLW